MRIHRSPILHAATFSPCLVFLLTLPFDASEANVGPVHVGAEGLELRDSATVEMVSETVEIRLSPRMARVHATFLLRNHGPADSVSVGFPIGVRTILQDDYVFNFSGDAMLVVVEPTRRSLGTAAQIKTLANDIGLKRLFLVGNKVRNEEEMKFLEAETPGMPLLGCLPADLKVQEADRLGIPVYDHVEDLKISAWQIASSLNTFTNDEELE